MNSLRVNLFSYGIGGTTLKWINAFYAIDNSESL